MATAATRPTEDRATLAARVAELRNGSAMGFREIAAEMGLSRSYVSTLYHDPTGEKEKVRKTQYAGRCDECGRPTSGSNGREKAPPRCRYCVQGTTPPESRLPPDVRRRVPVRLCDLEEDVLMAGAREACRWEKGLDERNEILLAALFPSKRVYWIAEASVPPASSEVEKPEEA